jgi:hypothetical protein
MRSPFIRESDRSDLTMSKKNVIISHSCFPYPIDKIGDRTKPQLIEALRAEAEKTKLSAQ